MVLWVWGWNIVTVVVNATQDHGSESPDFKSNGSRPKPRTYMDSLPLKGKYDTWFELGNAKDIEKAIAIRGGQRIGIL
jgi:hypothetical protein